MLTIEDITERKEIEELHKKIKVLGTQITGKNQKKIDFLIGGKNRLRFDKFIFKAQEAV
ncbi:MAG: hypothetical protein KJ706_01995 [Candidatus Omnitrophica bacterium]|nr:hypothetical protein [Candidatus Omnitrophota bacterium]